MFDGRCKFEICIALSRKRSRMEEKMKIAMMTNNYKPFVAGVPISIERLAEGLRRQGHQVVVFAPDYDGQNWEPDVVRYGSLLKGVAGGASVPNSLDFEIERRFKEGNFDVIHVHHPMMIGRTAGYLSWKYHVPLVFTYHTRYEQYLHYIGMSGLKKVMPAYVRGYTKHCDMVIAPTPLMKDYLDKIRTGAEVRVLPTGLPEESFYPDKEKAGQIRKNLLGDKKYLFCTVARLAKEKNLDFLLRSMKLLKEEWGSNFRLALIGDGPSRKELERKAFLYGINEEILFVGKVPNSEIKNYCHASDLFLFSSLSETQGIVLLESMAAGTPVVALHATGTEDVVINGKNGYMTRESEMEFDKKIMDILEKREIDLLRQGACETARNYCCEKITEDAVKTYMQAIWNRREKDRIRHGNRNQRKDMVYSG